MVIIQGPITFKKGQPIPDQFRDAVKKQFGFQEISKEEAKARLENFAGNKPEPKKAKAKAKKSKK